MPNSSVRVATTVRLRIPAAKRSKAFLSSWIAVVVPATSGSGPGSCASSFSTVARASSSRPLTAAHRTDSGSTNRAIRAGTMPIAPLPSENEADGAN